MVIGSYVMADAVFADSVHGNATQLTDLARWPFLWRSFSARQGTDILIDGRNLGYILSSYWSDPLYEERNLRNVRIITTEDGCAAKVYIPRDEEELTIDVTTPITLFSRARNLSVDLVGAVRLEGTGLRGGKRIFELSGSTEIKATTAEVDAGGILLSNGNIWLDFQSASVPQQCDLVVASSAKHGWGDGIGASYPWNTYPSTLIPPTLDSLTRLIDICAGRLERIPLYLVDADLSVPESSPEMLWARREGEGFSKLIASMLRHGLASKEPQQASGSTKLARIVFKVSWEDVSKATRFGTADPVLRAFVDEMRR